MHWVSSEELRDDTADAESLQRGLFITSKDRVHFGSHQGVRIRVKVRGTVPAGTGPIGPEKR